MQQHKTNRKERRYLERIAAQVSRAMEQGKEPVLKSHVSIGLQHSYRVVRDGRVVAEFGYER